MDTFGCCSNYKKCSDSGECIFPNDSNYAGCYYSKNLQQGKNFYSEKVIPLSVKQVIIWEPEKRIFLDCYERNFKIGHKGSKNDFSYPLSNDEHNILIAKLFELSIPHVTELEEGKCILEGTDEEPANSKVIFSLPECESEFIIGNYNQAFILPRYADGIMKSLQRKGINARIEYFGPYSHIRTYQKQKQETPVQNEPIQQTFVPKIVQNIEPEPNQCKQMSIFDLMVV